MDNKSVTTEKPKPEDSPKPDNSSKKAASQEIVETKNHSNKTLFIILGVVGFLVLGGILMSVLSVFVLNKATDKTVSTITGLDVDTNKNGDTTIKTKDGSITTKTDKNGNVTYETKDKSGASSSSSTEQKLPDNFPSNVPLYSNQKITYSSKSKTNEESNWQVNTETSDNINKVVDSLKESYKGWTVDSENQINDSYYLYYEKDNMKVNIYVAKSEDLTSILYTVSQKTATQ